MVGTSRNLSGLVGAGRNSSELVETCSNSRGLEGSTLVACTRRSLNLVPAGCSLLDAGPEVWSRSRSSTLTDEGVGGFVEPVWHNGLQHPELLLPNSITYYLFSQNHGLLNADQRLIVTMAFNPGGLKKCWQRPNHLLAPKGNTACCSWTQQSQGRPRLP